MTVRSLVREASLGLLCCSVIALAAVLVAKLSKEFALGSLTLSFLIGLAIANSIGTSSRMMAGLSVVLKPGLRLGIVLLGAQLDFEQIASIGVGGISAVAISVIAVVPITIVAAYLLNIDRRLALLLASGTAICGASAIIAANTVVKASDDDVAYSVMCVTVVGMVAMLVYPLLFPLLGMSERAYGVWVGSSIHEVAQVAVAGSQVGTVASNFSMVAKLLRVLLLAPMVLLLSMLEKGSREGCQQSYAVKIAFPWFVAGFVALAAWNSIVGFADWPRACLAEVSTFLLSAALAGIGLTTTLASFRTNGLRPLAVCALASCAMSLLSLVLIQVVGYE